MKLFSWLSAVMVLLFLSSSLLAQVTNGGFETGNLTGWNTNASTYGAGPADVYENGYAGEEPTEGQYLATLEVLAGSPGDGICFSELEQQFSVTAGDVLKFDWYGDAVAEGYEFEGGMWEAHSMVSVIVYETDPWSPIFDIYINAMTSPGWLFSSSGTNGWQTEQVAFDTPGNYTLQFRIDGEIMSMGAGEPEFPMPGTGGFVGVDNVRLVPEPSTITLLLCGLAGLALRRRRR